MQIDALILQYNSQPLRVPGSAGQVHRDAPVAGTGAHLAVGKPIDKKSPLYEQCLEFESIFVKMMLKEMRKTVDKTDSLVNGGFAEDIYQDLLDNEYSKTMSNTAKFGLADMLYRQLG